MSDGGNRVLGRPELRLRAWDALDTGWFDRATGWRACA
jgi:hypothetical protein